MAENQDGQEKTEAPSAKRLRDAREKGQVAKSVDATSAVMLLFGTVMFYSYSGQIGPSIMKLMRQLLFEANLIFLTEDNTVYYFTLIIKTIALGLVPFLLLMMILAVSVEITQVGVKFSTKKITDWSAFISRINLFAGIKRMIFSQQALVELFKGILKIIVIGSVIYTVLKDKVLNFMMLIQMPYQQFLPFLAEIAFELVYKVGLVYLMIGIADYFYQRYKFTDEMKMTKQEVKDETKATEGDMQAKLRMRQIGRDRLRRMMISRVKEATVVITNPTHYAVALQYTQGTMDAPKVVAKGVDNLALKIREVAGKHNIPIIEEPPLARALYAQVDVDQSIPEGLFKAVAQVLAYIHRVKMKKSVW
jgi:flagellar biosynthetic protein FlhB